MSNSAHNIPYELLVKNMLGEATAAEQATLDEMRQQFPPVEEAHAAMEVIWAESKTILERSSVNEHQAWDNFKTKINQEPVVLKVNRFNWYVAAIWFFAFSSLAALAYKYVFSSHEILQSGLAAYSAILPDASEVTLNKGATIDYSNSPLSKERKVQLQGDAYFKVKKAAKPFKIYVNETIVTVIGTSFYINGTSQQTTIEVETGIVQVIHRKDTVLLHAGDQLSFDAITAAPIVAKTKGKLYSYFVSGEIFCDNTPMRDLIVVLEKQFNTSFLLANSQIGDIPISAVFNKMDLARIISIIEKTLDLRFTKYENYYLIQAASSEEAQSNDSI